MTQLKIGRIISEKQVSLIGVTCGMNVYKWFKLTDEEKAISFAHELFDKQLEETKKNGSFFYSNVSIGTVLIPESRVDKYLGMNND